MKFENTERLKSLEYYLTVAEKQIRKLGGPIGKEMLRDEQAIGDVAHEIMLAEMRHDPTREGARTRKSLLNQYAIWAVYDYVKKKKKIKNSPKLELNEEISGESDIPVLEIKEEIRHLLDNSDLTERQKYCVEQHYLHSRKFREIAEELNISVWAVSLNVTNAISKIKKVAHA